MPFLFDFIVQPFHLPLVPFMVQVVLRHHTAYTCWASVRVYPHGSVLRIDVENFPYTIDY